MLTQASALRRFHQIDIQQTQLQRSLSRLASGSRLARSADDAAGTAIASGMQTQMRGQAQASANVQDGINYIQTADAGVQNLVDVLHRMRELSVQMANDTYTDADRQKTQEEIKQLSAQLTSIPRNTMYNGIQPLILSDQKVQQLAVKPDNRLDIELVIDGHSDPGMQLTYFNLMQTFQAVQADLNARGVDLRMGIALSGFNSVGPAVGNSAMTDNVDGVRLLQDATTDQNLMKQWLFYTIGPAQFDANAVTPFVPPVVGPGRFNTRQDNYNALVQSSGIAGADTLAGTSEAGVAGPTTNPLAPPPGPPAGFGFNSTPATTSDAMARRGGVTFMQVLLTNHAPTTLATPGAPVGAGAAAAREAQTAAILASDPNLRFVAGLNGGAGSAVAGAYDDIVAATGGFFFDLTANTPAAYSALADQFQAMIPPTPDSDPQYIVIDEDIRMQVGANEGQFLHVIHPHITARALKLEGADLSTQAKASNLIGDVDEAMKELLVIRAKLGASQNRLESAARYLGVAYENHATSYSRIHDTDVAAESANLTRRQILLQAATSLASQALPLENSAWSNLRQLIGS
jgi:flagellin